MDYKDQIRKIFLTLNGHIERIYSIRHDNNSKFRSNPYNNSYNPETLVMNEEKSLKSPILDYYANIRFRTFLEDIEQLKSELKHPLENFNDVQNSDYTENEKITVSTCFSFLSLFVNNINLLKDRFMIPKTSISKQKLVKYSSKIANNDQAELDAFLELVIIDLQTPNFLALLKLTCQNYIKSSRWKYNINNPQQDESEISDELMHIHSRLVQSGENNLSLKIHGGAIDDDIIAKLHRKGLNPFGIIPFRCSRFDGYNYLIDVKSFTDYNAYIFHLCRTWLPTFIEYSGYEDLENEKSNLSNKLWKLRLEANPKYYERDPSDNGNLSKIWQQKLIAQHIDMIKKKIDEWKLNIHAGCPLQCGNRAVFDGHKCNLIQFRDDHEFTFLEHSIKNLNYEIIENFAKYIKNELTAFDDLVAKILDVNIQYNEFIEKLKLDCQIEDLLPIYHKIISERDSVNKIIEDGQKTSDYKPPIFLDFLYNQHSTENSSSFMYLDPECSVMIDKPEYFNFDKMDCCVCQLLIKASPPCYDQCCREYGTDIIGLLNLKGITTQEVNLGKALEGDTIQKNLLKSLKIELNEEICQNYQKLKNNDEITRFLMELSPLPKEKVTEKIQKMWYNLTYGKIIQRLKRRSKEFDCDISDLFNTGRTYEFKTNDGHIVDSSYEVILDNFLSEKQILHFIPKSFQALSIPFYGDDTRSRPDFVLEDCYIEVAGLTEWELSDYREKMNQKSKMAEQLGIKLVVLTPKKNAGKESYFEISGNYKPGNLIDALANLRY